MKQLTENEICEQILRNMVERNDIKKALDLISAMGSSLAVYLEANKYQFSENDYVTAKGVLDDIHHESVGAVDYVKAELVKKWSDDA